MRHRTVVVLLMVSAVLGSARDGHAFMRWIDKLSGPGPFLGLQYMVRTDLHGHPVERAIGTRLEGDGGEVPPVKRRFTLGFLVGGAVSYRNNLNYGDGPGAGSPTVYLWSLEASAEAWPVRKFGTDKPWNFFVSGGLAANYFTGLDFDNLLRPSFVVRVGPRWNKVFCGFHAIEFGLEGQYFLRGFSPQDFGALPGPEEDRVVWGAFVHLLFGEE